MRRSVIATLHRPCPRIIPMNLAAPPIQLNQGDVIHDSIKVEGNGVPAHPPRHDRPDGCNPYAHSMTSPGGSVSQQCVFYYNNII